MKRRCVLSGLAVLVLVGMLVVWLIPSSGPTPANVKKIERGMTLAEVYAILGPPTEERWVPQETVESRSTWWTVAAWEPNDGHVIVVFYGGQVDHLRSGFAPSPWQRLVQRFGLGP